MPLRSTGVPGWPASGFNPIPEAAFTIGVVAAKANMLSTNSASTIFTSACFQSTRNVADNIFSIY
jgi:hypothetical protein